MATAGEVLQHPGWPEAAVPIFQLAKGRRLAPRLQPEAARRGQPVPRVHLPQDR